MVYVADSSHVHQRIFTTTAKVTTCSYRSCTDEEWKEFSTLVREVDGLARIAEDKKKETARRNDGDQSQATSARSGEETRDASLQNLLSVSTSDTEDDLKRLAGEPELAIDTSLSQSSITMERVTCRWWKLDGAIDLLKEKYRTEKLVKDEELESESKKLKLKEDTLVLERERLEFEKKKFDAREKANQLRLEQELKECNEKLVAEQQQRSIFMDVMRKLLEKWSWDFLLYNIRFFPFLFLGIAYIIS